MQEGARWVWRGKCQSYLDAQKRTRKHKYLGSCGESGCTPPGPVGPSSWAGGCLQPMAGTVQESPKQRTSHAALHHTHVCKLVTVHERCRIPAPTRQWGPVPLGGCWGRRRYSAVQPLALSTPRAPRGLAVTTMALQSHRRWLSCRARGLAVSWHPRHPHCADWVSSKQRTRPPCLAWGRSRAVTHRGHSQRQGRE